ncbi:sialate O-acetylesterase [Pseudopedobacter beijingensis]|uniref:Sialate O-acetylesterase n=1 Tax=Pseudopedobacter beijingensis TaxID=1207056 RepID=A0ABW4ICS4_9SPHI
MKKTLFLILSIFTSISIYAEVWTPRVIGDNMVLQRSELVKLWGKASPNAKVQAVLGNYKAEVKADNEGKWSLFLPAMEANKIPQVLKFYENGILSKEVKNVLIGEVWISGGQSNMAWTVLKTTTVAEARANADNPMIRFFTRNIEKEAAEPQEDTHVQSGWKESTKKQVSSFSAVSYYFAEQLYKDLNVPVGIVETAMGGTMMMVWLKREDMSKGFDEELKAFDNEKAKYNYDAALKKYEIAFKNMQAEREKAKTENRRYTGPNVNKPLKFTPRGVHRTPEVLYNSRIAPIKGYTAKGFIWYQGEADSGKPETFTDQFITLVSTWRKYWSKSEMPFYFAQLSSFEGKYDWKWGATRWAQLEAQKRMKNTAMVVTNDVGEEKDVHPQNKIAVGQRFENIAMYELYGRKEINPYSPLYKSIQYKEAECVVTFNTFGASLIAKKEASGIEVLSKDKWIATNKVITNKNGEITVKSPNGELIEGVRYLWDGWAQPAIFLYSDNGLPAAGFISIK